MYWRTASLVCIAGAIGLAVLLSVSALAGSGGLLAPPRIRFDQDGVAGSGLPWSWYARGPGEIRALGVLDLYYSLLLGAGAALAVSVLTLFCFAAAREREREVELSVRRAVGASRRLLLGSAVLESGVLIAVILAVGMPPAQALSSAALRTWPGMLAGSSIAPSVAVVAAIIMAVLFGAAVPIVFSRRKQVVEAAGAPLPLLIPATQLGLSLIVLTMATLLTRRTGVTVPEPGVAPRDGLVVRIALPASTQAVRTAIYASILNLFPGASLSAPGVIVGLGTTDVLRTGCIFCPDGRSRAPYDQLTASHRLVTADTFRTLNIRLVEGRLLTDQDRLGTAPVVVINRTLANKLPNPIGNQIVASNSRDRYATVVGIVEDVPSNGLGASHESRNVIYQSLLQHWPSSVELLLRPGPTPFDLGNLLSRLGAVLPPAAPVPVVTSEALLLAAEQAPVAWFGRRVRVIGWSMLVLAFTAILELMRMWVVTLRSELGIRLAVGATRRGLLVWVLVKAVQVGLAGILVGVWFGPPFWAGLALAFPGLPSWDPVVLLRYSLLLMGAAGIGAGWPAFRALRSTPSALIASEGT